MACYTALSYFLFFLLVGFSAQAQDAPLQLGFDATGLTSLSRNNHQFLATGVPRLRSVLLRDAAGTVTNGAVQGQPRVDAMNREVTVTYPWGAIRVTYTAAGSQFQFVATVSNTSGQTIDGLLLEPFVLRLPAAPREYDGNTPIVYHNIGGPTVLGLTYNGGSVALANEDTVRPLLVGFPLATDRPANLTFPLQIGTGRSELSDRFPVITRPVSPGGTDQYRLSLRFSTPARPLTEAAPDIYQRFASQNGMRFGWTDRRGIGTLFLASSAAGHATNPRGWFNDASVDVTTPEGVAAFQARVLAWANESVAVLRSMNAQGMIAWDVEGEEYPHPTTYIGDPRLVGSLAPEMEGVVDEFFRRFRDAGFRVGVTLRPQQFIPAAAGQSASQRTLADPTQLLLEKISYAKNRWGASLFYIDSNGDPSLPIPARIIAALHAAHPDVLLIPEHEDMLHYTFSTPYNELRGGVASTPAAVRAAYPTAFSMINTADGPIQDRFNDLVAAVTQGDILLFRGWYPDPQHEDLRRVYATAVDLKGPELVASVPDGPLSGTVSLEAYAADNRGSVSVLFEVNGQAIRAEDMTAPYSASLATMALSNGTHEVRMTARDTAGNTTTVTRSITVNNPEQPNCPGVGLDRFIGCYYDSHNLDTTPKLVRNDDRIDFNWGTSAPVEGLPNDKFAVRWRGVYALPAGEYEFTMTSDDGVRVFVDGQRVVDQWMPRSAVDTFRLSLDGGTHLIEVDYFDETLDAVARLEWRRL